MYVRVVQPYDVTWQLTFGSLISLLYSCIVCIYMCVTLCGVQCIMHVHNACAVLLAMAGAQGVAPVPHHLPRPSPVGGGL